ncbi:FXSXX-COOH protein [Streptomyces hyaluromycini]|uniref:FXSXX-COOH protein n=1 Tax=Streptomyces hyaluromycini TaxID=1377993 RepID=UPI001FE9E8E5|nr:FXSXX-COOH protein [Streptomyces hyaluromycini]
MDAPQQSSRNACLVKVKGLSPDRLAALAGTNTAFGLALQRHLQKPDSPQVTAYVVFNSAL